MATTYKILGQVAPSAATATSLYTVPSGIQSVISTLVVTNRGATAALYRIAIRPAGAALSNEQYIAFDAVIPNADSITFTLGITLQPTDVVTVYSSSADLSFSAFGSAIDL
jgi:hypothetical protein